MNAVSKQRWMLLLLLLLLATNLATLVYLWLPHRPPKGVFPPGSSAFDLLVKELDMTAAQQDAYSKLKQEHQSAVMPYREKIKDAKDGLFALLKNDTVSPAGIETAAANAALVQQELDLVTFQHFKKLRAICTAGQQKKFDEIIQDVIRQMGPPNGGLRGGAGGQPPPPGGSSNKPPYPPGPDGPPPGQ